LISKELLTFGGLVIVHNDRAEMEFLFDNVRVVECPVEFLETSLKVRDHPDFSSYQWPLSRNRFNNGSSPSYDNAHAGQRNHRG
jgi:hypothetical protein